MDGRGQTPKLEIHELLAAFHGFTDQDGTRLNSWPATNETFAFAKSSVLAHAAVRWQLARASTGLIPL